MKRLDDLFAVDKQLNARLRGEYDELAKKVGKCVFCDLKDKYILTEEKGMVLTVNIFPYIDGQLIIIPRRHIETMNELNTKEWSAIFSLSVKAIRILKKKMGIEGVWMVLREGELGGKSGKTVRHLHWNIMPYNEKLNTWHYQKLTITPMDLAKKLRPEFTKRK